MDEHEKRKVGQEVKEVQGWNVLQPPQDSGLLLQADPTGLQLQQKLLWAQEALKTAGLSSLLIQEKQEQLLRESGQRLVNKKNNKRDARLTLPRRVLLCARVCFRVLLWGASDYPDLLSRRLSAPVCTVNAVEVIIVGAEGGGVGGGG